jgi:energy-coupling factor transporter ATP-binding protein EcfA2
MTIAQGVLDWIDTLPMWQRDLARRVASSVELDTGEQAEVLSLVKAESGVTVAGPTPEPLPLSADDLPEGASGPVARLSKFGLLRGVGMVVEDAQIAFADGGITAIYGPNAAGKSSYARGLKALCHTVDRGSKVRGNVYAEGSPPPSANVEYDLGGSIRQQRTALRGEVLRLPGITMFDSACAELYVNDTNTIQYVPSPLLILTRMAHVQGQLRTALDAEIQTLNATRPTNDGLPEGTSAGHAVRALSGSGPGTDLGALAQISADERARLETLRAAVTAAEASTALTDAAAARADATEGEELATALEALAVRCDAAAAAGLQAAARDDQVAREALQLASERFERAPVSGIGSDPWSVLWEAARSFATSHRQPFPPQADGHCPLCLQEVDQDVADQLASFEAHVRSDVSATAIAAAARLREALERTSPTWADRCRTSLLARMEALDPTLATGINEYIDAARDHLEAGQRAPGTWGALAVTCEDQVQRLRAWAVDRKAHAVQLQATGDAEQLAALRLELRELEARTVLAARLGEFETWQETLRTLTKLDHAHTALATNKVTTQQRHLADTLIADALTGALKSELAALRCDHLPVKVDLNIARAETSVGLRLIANEPAELSDIVSEGEQRAIALAFFLSELTMLPADAGIIVDDPVSSLDEERRQLIADRLVEEATHRQVVVFTHDLPFLADLQGQADAAGVPIEVRGIWRLGDDVGQVDEDPPFKAMNLRKRIGVLKQRVAQWDSDPQPHSQDEARHRVNQFYSDLRISWERAVEERLFQGVVQRMQRGVKTLSLKHVEITTDLTDAVEAGMTRASYFVHDEPDAAAVPLPGRTQLAEDLEMLVDFEKLVPKR